MFPPEESPLGAAEFSNRSVPEIVAFLKTWRPPTASSSGTPSPRSPRNCVRRSGRPENLRLEHADQLAGARPIYVRRLLEGLQSAASNRRDFEWRNVLELVEFTFGQHDQAVDPATLAEGDDKNWAWACMTASELLAAGLRQGAKGIGFEHESQVRVLVFAALELAPKHPELRTSKHAIGETRSSRRRQPCEAPPSNCASCYSWLSRDASTPIGAAPREALQNLPEVRQALEAELADRSPDGRVPRAMMGRYLRWLFYFGEGWLKSMVAALFPANDDDLRRAAWRSHLGHDEGPLAGPDD